MGTPFAEMTPASGCRNLSSRPTRVLLPEPLRPTTAVREPAGRVRLSPSSTARSEERRVGKECRCRWSPDHYKTRGRLPRPDLRPQEGADRSSSRFFFSSRRRHTRYWRDWSSDVCSSDLVTFENGAHHGCAVTNKARVHCWGLNDAG